MAPGDIAKGRAPRPPTLAIGVGDGVGLVDDMRRLIGHPFKPDGPGEWKIGFRRINDMHQMTFSAGRRQGGDIGGGLFRRRQKIAHQNHLAGTCHRAPRRRCRA